MSTNYGKTVSHVIERIGNYIEKGERVETEIFEEEKTKHENMLLTFKRD